MPFESDRVCPACENGVPPGDESCSNCGTWLDSVESGRVSEDSEPAEISDIPEVPYPETIESSEQQKPERQDTAIGQLDDTDSETLCPHCGRVHSPEARFCPITGKPIRDDGAAKPIDTPIAERRTPVQIDVQFRKHTLWLIGIVIVLLFFVSVAIAGERYIKQVGPRLGQTTISLNMPLSERSSTSTISNFSVTTLLPSALPTASLTLTPTHTLLPTSSETATPVSNFGPTGKIVFTCQIFKDAQRNQICLINADGSDMIRLTTDESSNHFYPSFSPDGSDIVFSSNHSGSYQIYEMDLQGSQHQLTDMSVNSYAPAISPDSRLIAFTYDDGAHQTIWLMDRDGGNPHLLTRGEGDAWDAAWSSSGDAILFASGSVNAAQLFIVDLDGSNMRRITSVSNLRGRSDWSPDGVTVATYIGTSWNRELFLLDTDGSNVRKITSGGNNLAPSFSPDGRWIAFTSYMDNYSDENGCEIYIMRISDSEIIRLTENDYCDWQPRWGP